MKLRDGSYMVGIAWDKWPGMEMSARTEGEIDLPTGAALSKDGVRWTLHGAVHTFVEQLTPGGTNGLCAPSLPELDNGEVIMILHARDTLHYESRSRDGGLTWSAPIHGSLPGHNMPTALWRVDQNPKEIILVGNSSPLTHYPLSTAISSDGGKTWSLPKIIAKTEGSQVPYSDVTQATDGTFVAVWKQALPDRARDVRRAHFTRDWVLGK